MDARFNVLVICERMGWTLSEYYDTEQWFLDLIQVKMRAEAKAEAHAERQRRLQTKQDL